MNAKKMGGLILFLLLLLVGVLIASNYLGGYTALRDPLIISPKRNHV